MKLYTIGYILDHIKLDEVAYCYRGECEGMIIINDRIDDNYLKNINKVGDISECFSFKLDDSVAEEDRKQWLFFHELEEGELRTKVIASMSSSITESIKKGYKFQVV